MLTSYFSEVSSTLHRSVCVRKTKIHLLVFNGMSQVERNYDHNKLSLSDTALRNLTLGAKLLLNAFKYNEPQ